MYGARAVKGMVAVAGKTYRIVRVEPSVYAVVRILDDLQVGTFRSHPKLEVQAEKVDSALLMAIARQAIHSAKTSWVGSVRPPEPSPRSSKEARVEPVRTERVERRVSTNPPPNPVTT